MVGTVAYRKFAQSDFLFPRRVGVGLLVTLGTFEGLRHLVWSTIPGETTETLLPLFLSFGVWLGAFLSGLAFRHGIWSGLCVGLLTGFGFLSIVWYRFGVNWNQLLEVLLPPMVFGLMGGTLGRFVYRPAPILTTIDANFTRNMARQSKPVPLIWWKIILGAVGISFGVFYADEVRFQLAWLIAGTLSGGQAGQFTTWGIGCVLTLLGGIIAGMATKNGINQGFIAGILSSSVLGVLIEKHGSEVLVTPYFWANFIEKNPSSLLVIVAAFVSTTLIATFGGYMGSAIIRR